MLSYRHIYHAGNHADILKHLTVSQICRHFIKKDAPALLVYLPKTTYQSL
jgi:23S rRNA (adenine2030-N6)-methyltransferase